MSNERENKREGGKERDKMRENCADYICINRVNKCYNFFSSFYTGGKKLQSGLWSDYLLFSWIYQPGKVSVTIRVPMVKEEWAKQMGRLI